MDTPSTPTEKIRQPLSGYIMLVVILAVLATLLWVGHRGDPKDAGWDIGLGVLFAFLAKGLLVISPNTSKLLLLFGAYRGSIRKSGLWWVNPFYQRMTLSLRARNFESDTVKVNDKMGNPILISVILVWKVEDTYKAYFEVDDYVNFIKIQTDSAVRQLAASYPYDHFEDEKATVTLSTDFNEVNSTLEKAITERLFLAGIEVVEARITYLAYAPEIAHSMLKRQQASAVVAARHKIVEGAVGMVESALHLLSSKNIIEFDDEKKAAMVSNLMVVLCGDRESQPVVNTGTLNH
ncbi:MAG TPA: SPFH domain-containing protein [Puia sp.]|jgi:regulator of protease activity HflC (stomatin/prohibitin superfamily)|nr:SPFH domain-containing protein [Puia sp.]